MVALPFSPCEVIGNSEEVTDVDINTVQNGIKDCLVSGMRTVPTCDTEARSTVCPLSLGFSPCMTRDA